MSTVDPECCMRIVPIGQEDVDLRQRGIHTCLHSNPNNFTICTLKSTHYRHSILPYVSFMTNIFVHIYAANHQSLPRFRTSLLSVCGTPCRASV